MRRPGPRVHRACRRRGTRATVVACDITYRTLHHAAEPGYTVLKMHDVIARLHVIEEGRHLRRPGPGGPVRPPPPGQVPFGQHRYSQCGVYKTAVDRGDDDLEVGRNLVHYRGVKAFIS